MSLVTVHRDDVMPTILSNFTLQNLFIDTLIAQSPFIFLTVLLECIDQLGASGSVWHCEVLKIIFVACKHIRATLYDNDSSSDETNSTVFDTEATIHPFLSYMILFGSQLLILLVVVPTLAIIVIILKDRK